MIYKFTTLVLSLLFVSLCSFVNEEAANPEKRKISTQLYSITLPADWIPNQGMKGDGTVPNERNGGPYHLYYMGWHSKSEVFYDQISIFIRSYRRRDGTPLSIKDIEDIDMAANEPPLARAVKKEILKGKPGQRRYMVSKEGMILGGSYRKCRDFCLIQKGMDVVHHVNVFLHENVYQNQLGVQKLIDEILDSFVVNSKFCSEKHEKGKNTL